MKRQIQYKGAHPLTHNLLMWLLLEYRVSFVSLMFSQLILDEEIKKGLNNSTYNFGFDVNYGRPINSSQDLIDGHSSFKHIDLQDGIISELLLGIIIKKGDRDIVDATRTLGWLNHHFLRTHFLNAIYEILEKFVFKYGTLVSPNENKLRTLLRNEDWYCVLYILRNNASHADGLHSLFEANMSKWLKKDGRKLFNWGTISIDLSRHKYGHSIDYTSLQCLQLFDALYNFVDNHKDSMTTFNGHKLSELLP